MITSASKRTDKDALCPKCKGKMRKTGTINASNSTFVSYECDGCKHKESRCQGMLPEKDMY
jgi:hypothetical protein